MKSRENNKGFGLLFFAVFSIIGLWPIINGGIPRVIFFPLAFIFLVLGLINSKILTPFNRAWVKFGELLGMIIAPIVMALVYFLVLTPISIIVRIFGKDLLKTKLSDNNKSYWIKRIKDLGSMDKQF